MAAAERDKKAREVIASTVAPDGMPAPVTPMSTVSPVGGPGRSEMVVEPLAVLPVRLMAAGMKRVTEVEEAMVATVAPVGMPLPTTVIPTAIPVVVARLEIVSEPLVVFPVCTIVLPMTCCF